MGGFLFRRKVEKVNEFRVQGDAFYGAQNRKMNSQRYSGMVRFAHSFGKEKKWYRFIKTEGDHDRFANINVRITPSIGIGYWFWDLPGWKAMAELGAGVTFTDFRNNTDDKAELEIIPRAYLEKKLIGRSVLSQDAIAYPSLTEDGDYRFRLDTSFKNPITDRLSLRLSMINNYNSNPGKEIKKHDLRLMSSFEYAF